MLILSLTSALEPLMVRMYLSRLERRRNHQDIEVGHTNLAQSVLEPGQDFVREHTEN